MSRWTRPKDPVETPPPPTGQARLRNIGLVEMGPDTDAEKLKERMLFYGGAILDCLIERPKR